MDLKIIITILLLGTIVAQLSSSDKAYIKNFILQKQDATTNLFNKSYSITYMSVFSLQSLEFQVPNATRICRELSFEVENPTKLEFIELNKILNCKLNFSNYNVEDIDSMTLPALYQHLRISEELAKKTNWDNVYSTLQKFYFDNRFTQTANSTDVNLKSTGQGLELLVLLYKKIKADIETKNLIKEKIKVVSENLKSEFQSINQVI
jgi:hypothetical protein